MRLIDADALPNYRMELKDADTKKVYVFDVTPLEVIRSAPTVEALPLHCRIGDTVWVVGTKCLSGLYDEECASRNKFEGDDGCEDCPLDQEVIVFSRTVNDYNFCKLHDLCDPGHFRWGETVFKNKEEAEAALAKMA